jgi:hypothetical protein
MILGNEDCHLSDAVAVKGRGTDYVIELVAEMRSGEIAHFLALTRAEAEDLMVLIGAVLDGDSD